MASTVLSRQWLFLGAALLLIGSVIGWNLYADRNTIDAGQRERLAHQARIIDDNLAKQLLAVNLALESIRSDLPLLKVQKDSKVLINRRLQAMSDAMPGVRTLFIFDADATVIASNRKVLIGVNFRERDYFQTARQSRNPAMLHVSPPYKTVLGVFAMTMVKVIPDERGGVAGMVGATIDPEYFKTLLNSVRYAPDMRTSLTHANGKLFLMIPQRLGTEGADLATPGSFFTRHRDSGQQASVMTGIVYATGEECMVAQRTIKPANVPMDKGLVVAVARDLPTIFAVWRRDAFIRGGLFGVLVLATTLGLYFNQKRQRAYERLEANQETERKLAEALRESEEKYRQLFELEADAILLVDKDTGNLIEANRVAESLYGYSREEFLRMKNTELSAKPDETKRATQEAWKHIPVRYHRKKDGTVFPVEIMVNIFQWRGRQVHLAAMRDITERKRAEEALQESEKRLSEAQRIAHVGSWELDIQTHALLWSDETFRLFAVQRGTFNPTMEAFFECVHPDDRSMMNAVTQAAWYEGKPFDVEHRIVCPDGAERTVHEVAEVIFGDAGQPIRMIGTVRDITERKRAEAEKQILQERLQHADKMEAIGTLAGGIAHDFNNLLMGIQGHASLTLLDLDPSHPHYEHLKSIEEQVQSGADLTRQLLGFARGGRYEVKPADMNDIIKKTSFMFGRTKKEISIHRKYGKDLFTVEVDWGQMEQVFMNLYVNAWQAMPGGGEIHLETQNVLLDDEQAVPYAVIPGRYVKITISDTGTGMDEKTRERIFDPFFTTKEMRRGTGLGLATVYGIIKGHKGMIHVDSEPGHGTTFTIYLPASEKEVVKAKTAPGTIARGTETILLVDDEKMVLEVSRKLLESMGYRVYATGSGQEAIAVYMEKQKEIDMVILDVIMPGISGGETFDRLREINPGIKVLLSSGYSIEGQAQEILDRGCNGFLQKPFRLANLSRKVREMLD